ncbi:MAG: DNA-directed RNA polymerase subunit alpha C-terminal domain-containing protein [Patescibacteria group bacterium]
MEARYVPNLRKQYVMLLWHLGISSLDIATTLRIDPEIVVKDLRAGIPSGPILPAHGSDLEYAQAYAAALFGELQLPPIVIVNLLGVIESHPNPHRWPVLQERVRTMQGQLATATARIGELEDALSDIQRVANATVGENCPRRWNENLSKNIDETRFSLRANDVLKALGVKFYWELAEKSEANLSKMCDRKRLAEIKDILTDLGLSLGMDLKGFPGKNA